MANLGLIAPYFRRSFLALGVGLIALTACDFGQMWVPLLVGGIIDALAYGAAASAGMSGKLAVIVGLAAAVAVLRYAWRNLIYGFSRRMEKDLRARLYARFVSLSVTWHNRNSSGDLMALATNDIESVRLAVGFGLVSLVDSVVLGAAAVVFMLSISPGLCLWAFMPLPLISVLTAIFGRRIFDSFLETQNLFGDLTETVREHVSGFKVIRAMALESLAKREIDREGVRYMNRNVRLSFVMGLFFPFLNLLANLAVALTLFFGGRAAITGEISPGEFVAFLSYLGLLAWPLMAMGLTLGLIQQGLASLARLSRVLSAEEELPHPAGLLPDEVGRAAGAAPYGGGLPGDAGSPSVTPGPDGGSGSPRVRLRGFLPDPAGPPADVSGLLGGGFPIAFAGVSYTYPGRNDRALSDFTANLDPHGFTALTGPTGSGKSTLASLLPALLEPDSGQILINGMPSTEYRLDDLRSLFGLVPQDGHIFTGTLLDNIRFGRPGATREEAGRAAEAAGLRMDPRVFPEGLDTRVGEKGVTLSGGQKQRAALARALLTDPPYLILDDTLSAVDASIEEEILDNLVRARRGRGTLVVSHRVTSLRRAGTFLVLEKGVLTASGDFGELSGKPGYFRRIVDLAWLGARLSDAEDAAEKALREPASGGDADPSGRDARVLPADGSEADRVAPSRGTGPEARDGGTSGDGVEGGVPGSSGVGRSPGPGGPCR
ncbi:MAG: ABC transporter ATP-binding protein/permease [Deltaproteobacteria bacterium]|jgi:ATP-binding cassette subfamily B protein|nr:ABC transporter ATP-binding protein/permease [Deltaproteobacteria bacterium]